MWAVEKLIHFIDNCKKCSFENTDSKIDTQSTESSENGVDTKTANSAGLTNNANNMQCTNCNNCNDQLEQLFNCLFGYKKSRVKYLANHKVEKIDYTLENSLCVYRYFKPDELPEYDSIKKPATEVLIYEKIIL